MLTHKKHFYQVQIPMLLLGIFALVHLFNWQAWMWLIATFLYWFVAYVMGEGITYHRYFGHDAFEWKYEWMPKIITLFCMSAGFGNPINWRSTHIDHHRYSDKEGDPHSPKDSFWHGAFGWHTVNRPINFLVCRKLLADKYYVWISEHTIGIWWAMTIAIALIDWRLMLYTIGLGGLICFLLVAQVTAYSHRYGTVRFDTGDDAKNSTWLSWITWVGSGALQNNHHAYPGRWHDSHAWYEFDIGKWIIPLIAKKETLAKI